MRDVEFIIMRHCERSGPGLSDPLTPRGAADAERLAEGLMRLGIDGVWVSPYRRSQETIAPFAAASGLEARIDPRLAEWRVSEIAIADFARVIPATLADLDHRPPFSETLAEVWTRVRPLMEEIAQAGFRRPALACHGGILGVVLAHLTQGFGPEHWVSFNQPTVVRLTGAAWERLDLLSEAAA